MNPLTARTIERSSPCLATLSHSYEARREVNDMEQENVERECIGQYEPPQLTDLGEFGEETGLLFGFHAEFLWPITLFG